jgi:hypothetical protein
MFLLASRLLAFKLFVVGGVAHSRGAANGLDM